MEGQAVEPTTGVSRGLLVGGLMLTAVGGLLVVAGGLVTTVVAAQAARQWVQRWEEPPRVVARRRLMQARSAVTAGAQGWRANGRLPVVATASGHR